MQSLELLRGFAAALVVGAAILAITRRFEVRLVIFSSALALAALAGDLTIPFKEFFRGMVNPTFIVPICCSLGFAHVVKACGCDQHLVWLLMKPIVRFRALLLPGVIITAFLVNIPIVSQTGTAATVGPIALPLLAAAGYPPPVAGAALLLGCSVGGELVNPSGPEYGTVITAIAKITGKEYTRAECVQNTLPGIMAQLLVATILFCWFTRKERTPANPVTNEAVLGKTNIAMALSPTVPLVLLFLCSPPFGFFTIPPGWLATPEEVKNLRGVVDYRTIGFAMLVGLAVVIAATAVFGERRSLSRVGHDFFIGAGYAYTEVISLIIVAKCFATAATEVGFGKLLNFIALHVGELFSVAAVVGTAAFAMLCGSGIAATQGLFPLFAQTSQEHNMDPFTLGCMVVLASAAGRTSSPVAAAAIMSANLAGTNSWQLTRRVFLPLCAGLAASFVVQSLKG